MTKQNFKAIGTSVTSPRDNRQRKEVLVDAPACWDEDYEKEIYARASKYYHKYVLDGTEQDQHRHIRFKIYFQPKSTNKVIVEVRLRTEGGSMTITSEPLAMYQAVGMQEVVEQGLDFWNKRFNIKIADPNCKDPRCRSKVMEIEYRIVWIDMPVKDEFNDLQKPAKPGFYHSKMLVYEDKERESVGNGILEISLNTNTYIAAHEYAHLLGIPDEYPDEEDGKCVRYVKPNGSMDAPIDLLEYKQKSSKDAGVMSTQYKFATAPRHAWSIAIEVQELLTSKLGRPITCDIIQLR
jgi:type VI secretion system secreted protein VgrG